MMTNLCENPNSIPNRFKFRWWDNYDRKYTYNVQNLCESDCFGSTRDNDEQDFADNFGELLKLQAKGYGVVEQCTGIRDANGQFVFENDIVECSQGKCLVKYAFDNVISVAGFGPVDNWVEVIGNIHENLNLLRTND